MSLLRWKPMRTKSRDIEPVSSVGRSRGVLNQIWAIELNENKESSLWRRWTVAEQKYSQTFLPVESHFVTPGLPGSPISSSSSISSSPSASPPCAASPLADGGGS